MHLGLQREALRQDENYITLEGQGIRFHVAYPLTLKAVSVYPKIDGYLEIQLLKNGSEHPLYTTVANVPPGKDPVRIPLDMRIPPGEDYRLIARSARQSAIKLYHRPEHEFPHSIDDVVYLVSGVKEGESQDSYYFFYDWEVTAEIPHRDLEQPEIQQSVAGRRNHDGDGGFLEVQNEGINFEVFRDLIIQKVTVYPETSGKVIVRLVDPNSDTVLKQSEHTIASARASVEIELNFELKPGLLYRLDAVGSNVKLFRNENVNYPFIEESVIRLIQGVPSENEYYYFYDWRVTYPAFPQPMRLSPGEIKWAVKDRLHTYRNLCEDFVNVCDLEREAVAVCTDLEIDPSADVDRVLAEVFYKLAQAISPRVRFYSLQEMLEKGKVRRDLLATIISLEDVSVRSKTPGEVQAKIKKLEELARKANSKKELFNRIERLKEVNRKSDSSDEWLLALKPLKALAPKGKTTDQIFEGPPLTHGFIDDEEFQTIQKKCEIRASDVIQILMDVPGVVAVKNLSLLSFVEEQLRAQEPWILRLTTDRFVAPEFSPDRSKVIFYKNDLPYYPNRKRVLELLKEQQASDIPTKLKTVDLNLPIPVGEDKQLETYYPIQNELPANYCVGKVRVAESQTSLRRAQSRQLKAYLLFFEQLLANYLSQLANVRKLFSWGQSEIRTYFTQPIYDIAELESLYSEDGIVNGLPTSHPILGLRPETRAGAETEEDFMRRREEYLPKKLLPAGLDTIIEDAKTAEMRKENFLGHLVARFAESFTDYSLLMFNIFREKSSARVIEDKRLFLENYPAFSRQRSTAYDYRFPEVTENVSGFQHRLYRVLGIRNVQRVNLAGSRLCIEEMEPHEGPWRFVLKGKDGTNLFESVSCESKEAIEMILDFALKIGGKKENGKEDNYEYVEESQTYRLVQKCGEKEEPKNIGNTTSGDEAVKEEVKNYFHQYGNSEGFHVVEHMLLRLRSANETGNDPFMKVQLASDDTCDCVEARDPYSFRLTIVLPSWSTRFQDLKFRRFVEQTIRLEVPAHIYPKICWVSHDQMKEFETCYSQWAEQLASLTPVLGECRTAVMPRSAWPPSGEIELPNSSDHEEFGVYEEKLRNLIEKIEELVTVHPLAQLHDCIEVSSDAPQISLNNTNLGTL